MPGSRRRTPHRSKASDQRVQSDLSLLPRRDFLKLSGVSASVGHLIGCATDPETASTTAGLRADFGAEFIRKTDFVVLHFAFYNLRLSSDGTKLLPARFTGERLIVVTYPSQH